MIRIVVENLFFFLLPTLGYIAWVAFEANDWPGLGPVLRTAPLAKLFVAGAAIMFGSLAFFATRAHNVPGEVYVPAVFKDGHIEPGHADNKK